MDFPRHIQEDREADLEQLPVSHRQTGRNNRAIQRPNSSDSKRPRGKPRGIKLVENFYKNYNEIYEEEIKNQGYFSIIKRSPLYICKK